MPQKVPCTVAEIIDHGEHVYSVVLKPETPAPMFNPGQFMHLALDGYRFGDFWPESRPFSIASAPHNRQLMRITYAVKGDFTTRMESEMRPGGAVWAKLPYGSFTIATGMPACLLAGGTGVTAFTAFLSGLGPEQRAPIYLLYGARRPDLLIYRPLVESANTRCMQLRPHFFVEEGHDAGCIPGRLNLDTLWNGISDPRTVLYYLSGPPGMLTTMSADLAARGVDRDRILIDAWQ